MSKDVTLSLDEGLLLEYAINTAIDHIEFLKTLHVNLPELKPEANTIGKLIELRDKVKPL